MRVILNKDVDNLGEEGDVKVVKDGYARNYLFPQGFAVPYNKHSLDIFQQKKKAITKRKLEKKTLASDLKTRIEAEELLVEVPAGDNGKLFGSVNNAVIAELLEKKGIPVPRKKIEIPDGVIKNLGHYTITVKLYDNEEASLKVLVGAVQMKDKAGVEG